MNLCCGRAPFFAFLISAISLSSDLSCPSAVWAESLFLEPAKTRQDPAKGEFYPMVGIKGLTQNPEGIWTAAEAKSKATPEALQPETQTTSFSGEKIFTPSAVPNLTINDPTTGRRIVLEKNGTFPIPGNTAAPSIANEKFLYPFTQTFSVSIPYGLRAYPTTGAPSLYRGVGIAAPKGTPVLASFSGSVLTAGSMGNLGNGVVLGHGNDYRTRYGHLSKVLIRAGTFVVQGQKIGFVGDTGQVSEPLLHFETWQRKKKEWTAKNPTSLLKFDAKTYKTAMKFQSLSSRSIRGVKGVPNRLPEPPKLLK
jgi:murein DD-endopeptidase MepM/ murein hydrolase activator NlpD